MQHVHTVDVLLRLVLFLGLELAVTESVTLLGELLVVPVILAVVNFFVRPVAESGTAVELVKPPRRTVLWVLAVPMVVVLDMPLCPVLCTLLAQLGAAVELVYAPP